MDQLLSSEVRGLSTKTWPVLTEADRQPSDPGVKGDLLSRAIRFSVFSEYMCNNHIEFC